MFDWERNWRGSGIFFVVLFAICWLIYGSQPKVGASADKLVSFYDGDRTRILIAGTLLAFNLLNLLWFAAALSSVLRDAGMGGWGTAATASSAALGAVLFVIYTVNLTLAYSIAGSGNDQVTSGLNDLSWISAIVASFPAAMLVMSGSFGLWRAGFISTAPFLAGVTVMVLVLLRATTWADDGFWAPDGAYTQYISTIVTLAWVAVVSAFLYMRSPATAKAPERAAVPAP
jgi:MFS family permease